MWYWQPVSCSQCEAPSWPPKEMTNTWTECLSRDVWNITSRTNDINDENLKLISAEVSRAGCYVVATPKSTQHWCRTSVLCLRPIETLFKRLSLALKSTAFFFSVRFRPQTYKTRAPPIRSFPPTVHCRYHTASPVVTCCKVLLLSWSLCLFLMLDAHLIFLEILYMKATKQTGELTDQHQQDVFTF